MKESGTRIILHIRCMIKKRAVDSLKFHTKGILRELIHAL
jgi:hypothetical protein